MRANISNFNTVNFKGYDACPIKNIYMEGVYDSERKQIYHELKDVCKKEDIELFYDDGLCGILSDDNPKSIKFMTRWAQDNKAIILRKGEKALISKPNRSVLDFAYLKHLNLNDSEQYIQTPSFTTGGNTFIGIDNNGKKWALVGSSEEGIKNLEEFCNAYDIEPKNVHIITQPNYHLDMAIRPIGYPYVLVNDESIAKEQLGGNAKLDWDIENFYEKLTLLHPYSNHPYADCDKTVKELEDAGFIPIRIGGVYTNQINYMNAIVNEHPDGTISYITNSAKDSEFEGLNEVFERELRKKVPNIRDVYFISGGKTEGQLYPNTMMEHLGELHGGIHCLTLEEPNFERWG